MTSARRHTWQFTSGEMVSGRTVVPVLIGVCTECGVVRTVVAIAQQDTKIDLRGECPGR